MVYIGGPIVKYFYNGHAIYAIIMAGIFMFLAALSVLRVQDVRSSTTIETPKLSIKINVLGLKL